MLPVSVCLSERGGRIVVVVERLKFVWRGKLNWVFVRIRE